MLALADRLWERVDDLSGIEFTLSVVPDREFGPVASAAQWVVEAGHVSLNVPGSLRVRTELYPPRVTGSMTESVLTERPAEVARLVLETSAAELLARRNFMVVHGGTVVGPAGAVVVRGRSGAGKSTLVAAAYRAGFGVLGDETVLVSRDDCDELAATVRDLTVLPDTARLLALEETTEPAAAGDRQKRRIDLFSTSTPAMRRARRAATVLLGERDRVPAWLVPLAPSQFAAEFSSGGIAQERWAGDPDLLASAWGQRGGFRLDGAADLSGALRLLEQITGISQTIQRAS